VCCSVLRCVAVCCSVLQCVAVCCSVLQCVAVCRSTQNKSRPQKVPAAVLSESSRKKYKKVRLGAAGQANARTRGVLRRRETS